MAMILGSYTFALDPARVTGLDADGLLREKAAAEAVTLTGHVLFQWAPVTAGTEIVLEWQRVDTAMWNSLQTMAEATSAYTFNPDIGGATYSVIVTKLEAQSRDVGGMREVRLRLCVRS